MTYRTYHSRNYTIDVEQPEESRYEATIKDADGEEVGTLTSTLLINARIRAERIIDELVEERRASRLARLLYAAADIRGLERGTAEDATAALEVVDDDTLQTLADMWGFERAGELAGHVVEAVKAGRPLELEPLLDVDAVQPDDDSDEYEAPELEPGVARDFLEALTNDELREWLREHDLTVSGTKSELVDRIIDALTEDE